MFAMENQTVRLLHQGNKVQAQCARHRLCTDATIGLAATYKTGGRKVAHRYMVVSPHLATGDVESVQ